MSDESSREGNGDVTSSSSTPSLQPSGGSRSQSSLSPSKSVGSSSGNSSMTDSLARPHSSSSGSEQSHHEPTSASSSKGQTPSVSSSPPSDILLHPPRPKIKPEITRQSGYPWLSGPPAQFTYYSQNRNIILPLIPPYSRCRSESSSQMSHSSGLDSKYPSALHMPNLGMIPFDTLTDEDEETGNDSEDKGVQIGSLHVSWRGVSNMLSLLGLVGAIIALFVIYPVVSYYRYGPINSAIAANTHINSTGQAQVNAAITPRDQLQMTDNDPATPPEAFTIWGNNGAEYELTFSDERVAQGRAATRCINNGFVEVKFVKDKEIRHAYWMGEWTVVSGAEVDLASFIERLSPNDESVQVTLHVEGDYCTVLALFEIDGTFSPGQTR